MSITVFLADDHAVLRDGLRSLLETQNDIRVIGSAANGRQAVSRILELRPDIAIMDIAMPELNGIDAAWQVRHECPSTQVIILSMHAADEHLARAFEAGVRGYLLKDSAGAEVINAVRAVRDGHRYLSSSISDKLIDDYERRLGVPQIQDPLKELSPREREILQLIVEGKSTRQIALILSLSPKTVETYRSHIMSKLEISDVPSLVRFAIKHGLTFIE